MSTLPRLSAGEALIPGALERAGYIDPEEVPRQASRGQIMILFALFLTAMLGVLGLAMDVGYAVSQRRMMQNAADLAAISGALSVANYSENNIIAALTTVQSTIDGNQTHEGSPALEVCNYVNDALATVASCDAVV
ncbi:MAG: Tad domain-containing protein, partial [Chloroflexota bacterium]|nr:Tad domain-containing protein [Chloroflexota bacterium]